MARSGEYQPLFIYQAGERRLARVESIRALAATALVSGHIWGIGHGYAHPSTYSYLERAWYGTALSIYCLLALTGYLLAWPFVRQYFGGGKAVNLRSYALNRCLRLFPLYLITIVVLLIFQEGGGSFEQWLLFPLLLQNFTQEHIATVDGPTWTVVVEWHFYVLLPLLSLGLAWLARGRAGLAAALVGVLFAVSLAVWIVFVTIPAPESFQQLWRYNLPANFYFFASGILLAFFRLRVEQQRPAWLEGPLGQSDVWILAAVPVWLLVWWDFQLLPAIALASFLMLGGAVLPLRVGRILPWLDLRWLAVLGVASYSLYVLHLPIIENLQRIEGFPQGTLGLYAVALPICIAAALVSFRVIEAPFLKMRQRWSPASAAIDKSRDAVEITREPDPARAGAA